MSSAKGLVTRERILNSALALFRERGFDATTMRDIAQRAQLSLGAAYHYFDSKEALVMGYYQRIQAAHADLVIARLAEEPAIRARLGIVVTSKLDLVAEDIGFLGALMRFAGQPAHPLSFFGPGTREIRRGAIALFRAALAPADLPADLAELVPAGLWALHMGLLLFAIYDRTPGLERTRRLADQALDLAVGLLRVARLGAVAPLRRRLAAALVDAGLTA